MLSTRGGTKKGKKGAASAAHAPTPWGKACTKSRGGKSGLTRGKETQLELKNKKSENTSKL